MAGLYAGPWDYLNNRVRVSQMGISTLRLTQDNMTDDAWVALQQDGYQAHVTITGADRAGFADDATWIAAYLAQLDRFLTRWPAAAVEIWNEPNFGMWSGATSAQKQLAYGNLLEAAYAHVKTYWPATTVVGFGAGGASAAAPGFIRGVFAAVPAAAKSFDVCSLHPYIDPTAPEKTRTEPWGSWNIAGQVNAIRAAGVTKPIWFTETGWQISQADGGRFNCSPKRTVSPQLQAAYSVRLFMLCLKLGVERVHQMYIVDADNYNGGFFSGSTARPQAVAMQTQQRLVPSPTGLELLSDGRQDIYIYRIATARGPITTAWSDSGSVVALPCRPGSTVRDLSGNVVTTAKRSSVSVRLTSSPVYVVPPG